MKKIFTLIAAMAVTAGAMANEYTGPLSVLINGFGSSQESTVTINKQDAPNEEGQDLYTLSINNFCLVSEETVIPVGNIVLSDMPANTFNGRNLVLTNQSILIQPGNDPAYAENEWYGPILGEVPVSLVVKFNDTEALVDIVIDFREMMEQLIYVNFDNTTSTPQPGVRGDLNGDGNVNTGDVSTLYGIILGTSE